MSTSIRTAGVVARLSCIAVTLASIAGIASAQTAPQLLPYTAKVIAGGGSTAVSVGATCGRIGATPSGNISSDKYGDNCLATEVNSSELYAGKYGPIAVTTDAKGAIYIGDNNYYLVRRIDPATGIITLIAGGTSKNATQGAACTTSGGTDSAHTAIANDLYGDGCVGTSVALGSVSGLAFSPSGDLYIADEYSHNVRKMSFSNGGVAAVVVTSPGSGYTTAPTVTFSAPVGGGTTATGTATISGGVITGVTITNPGSGYSASAMPTVTFGASGSGTTATGTAVYTGVMSMAAGDYNGGSIATTDKGYNIPCDASKAPATTLTAGGACILYYPYGITFDAAGNLYITEEYLEAVLVLNTTASPTTVMGQTIPPYNMIKIAGSRAASAACINLANANTSTAGCNYGNYTSGSSATTQELDAPYAVAVDSNNNVFIADEYLNNVAEVSASTQNITSYAGASALTATGVIEPQSKRAPAGFTIGTDFGLAIDPTNNLYVADALAGYVWRIDAPTTSMYVVGGGGATTTAGSPCSTTGIGANFTATDTYGDGCPGLLATFSKSGTTYATTGVWGLSTDTYGDIFVADEGNGLVREIASGTQFGNTGAVATDYIDIHFAAGDTPITASGAIAPFAITSGATIFSVGTPTCTTNAADNTTDCVVPVTASPYVVGPYSGTLTVKSTNVPAGTGFALSGTFTKSPNTRLSLAVASTTTSCGAATTFSNADTVAITASLILSGPVPSGTITFYSTPSGGTATQIGTPQSVGNLGTSTAPVYGAILNYTFATPGSYTISAVYSGDTTAPVYYHGSTGTTPTNALTSAVPTFTLAATTDGTATVHGGCPPGEIGQCVITSGQTALYSVALTETVYTGTITFSCSGAPANSTCVVAPTSLTATGCSTTGTLAVSVITSGGVPAQTAIGLSGSGPWQLLSMAFGIGLALMIGLRRRKLHLRGLWMAVALLLTSSGLLACSNGIANNLPITPKGTYTITVTATGSTGTTSSVALPLTIQ